MLNYFDLSKKSRNIPYSTFLELLNDNSLNRNISKAVITGNDLVADCDPGCVLSGYDEPIKVFNVVLPNITIDKVDEWNQMLGSNVQIEIRKNSPSAMDYLFQFSPWLLIIAFWFFIMRRMQGGGGQGGIFSFAKSKARIISPDKPKVMFKDVAGCEEAKTELQEIVGFLKSPKKYSSIGAKIPRGALLLGPPGTGKTLLAKAVSGEAKVPFFTISGAEFVEMFVGVGASRVRDLFDQAKKNSPSIIFIDEIDAVGRHRGAGLGGGHDEREQTLNQILVEMDGFDTKSNVILLAATNRPDVLDKALLRPGRFDRQIVVDTPDLAGREAILKIHTRKVPLSKDVNLKTIAKGTPGLAGADLENLVNESALLAARNNKKTISMVDFENAKDKVMMGIERKSMVLTPSDKKIIAYHEAGHALVAYHTKGADPVHKITIIPRGQALGITAQIPEIERFNYSKTYMLGRLNILMGGRCAEKLIFHDTTTGAGNDIEVATNIARKMVCDWGMSDKIGPLKFGKKDEEVFLGKELSQQKNYSEEKSILIDSEISSLVKNAESEADDILSKFRYQLDDIAHELLEKETISGDRMRAIIESDDFRLSSEPINKKSETATSRRRKNKP
ncbi:MAG: cell division protein FtsH [Candidatus Marinimicrobia bacterium]|nr:cell division protein FtsH [Candidatus Neomarinimicrobiota bacterium]